MRGDDVPVATDSAWQREARRHQSRWRDSKGLDAGLHNGTPLGSRLTLEGGAPPKLAGYLTDAAKRQVQLAVTESADSGALLSRPRLWVDLLSSQPLCFNLFGDMAEDLQLATAVFSRLFPGSIDRVDRIRFEYSPGRGDPLYTGARSAFDVFVEATGPNGRGFLGVEVKYHENMRVAAATDRGYAELARAAGVFHESRLPELVKPPLQQLLLDHLLALRLCEVDRSMWQWCKFVFLIPQENLACHAVSARYAGCLHERQTFGEVTIETVVDALRLSGAGTWVDEFAHRYLEVERWTAKVADGTGP